MEHEFNLALIEFHRRHPSLHEPLAPEELIDLLSLALGKASCDHSLPIPDQTADAIDEAVRRYRPSPRFDTRTDRGDSEQLHGATVHMGQASKPVGRVDNSPGQR